MNLQYLKESIIPKREQEIKTGENLATSQPIYIVYDLQEHLVYGHEHEIECTNLFGKKAKCMYIDRGEGYEDMEAKSSTNGMSDPEEIMLFWTNRYRAIFLTSEAAHDYLRYQSHNLNDPFVYVHNTGYANKQMDNLLKGE